MKTIEHQLISQAKGLYPQQTFLGLMKGSLLTTEEKQLGLKSKRIPNHISRMKENANNGMPMYRVAYDDGIAIVREDFLSENEHALLKINN